MRNNDEHEQPDELQQPQQQPTLPLLYLPIELAEEISLYIEGRAAAKLLRVSRSFHSLFLPRVWNHLSTFAAIKDDEARQHLLEKHGHFVCSINLTNYKMGLFNFDWLPFVKCATYLRFSIHEDTTAKELEMLMELIKQSNMLRTLNLYFDKYDTPAIFDELAAAINGLEYLERIACEFGNEYGARNTGSEWDQAVSFVDLLHPSKKSKLRFKMNLNAVLNEAIVQVLAPYIVELRTFGDGACIANLAHRFFGVRNNDGQLLVFPQLKELTTTSCCFKNTYYYGVKNITVSRLPRLQILYFDDTPCGLLDRGEPSENDDVRHNWKPEYSGYPHIIVPPQRWQCLTELTIAIISSSILMDIIDLNPQLQRLAIRTEYSDIPIRGITSVYDHDQFQLDTILDRLPHLVEFTIGRLNSRLVTSLATVPTKRRRDISITIERQMSVAPSAVAYILQMPQLICLILYQCVFADVDETIRLLRGCAAVCGVKWFRWNPLEWNQDLALAVTEKMPQLECFKARKCPKEHHAVFEAKCEFHT